MTKPMQIPEMNDDLLAILGRPSFQCHSLANGLRLSGVDIPYKAEAEQAHSLRLLLNCYFEDPVNWTDLVATKLQETFTPANDRCTFGTVQHYGKESALITVAFRKREGTDDFESFFIKAIFKRPYVLEEGIYFKADVDATNVFLKVLDAGEKFDRSLVGPEAWTYQEIIDLLDSPSTPSTQTEVDPGGESGEGLPV